VTLRGDLEEISAMVRSGKEVASLERDEHARYQLYVEALSVVSPERERELIAAILRDPDLAMKTAAVVHHVDAKAASLPTAEQVSAWAKTILDLVGDYAFAGRRIEEWILFKKVLEDDVSELPALRDATDWLQRKVVEESRSQPALELLAEAGRTKRVRNMAKQQLSRFKRR
jgi:hypothetical protein